MKKLLTLVLALAMTLSLAACGGGGAAPAAEGCVGHYRTQEPGTYIRQGYH